MKTLTVILIMLAVAGCSGQARKDYYEAVAVSSVAHSETQAARYEALSLIAAGSGGDAASRTAAVMAIAMLRETTIQPKYVEDEALSWARVLAAPIAGVTALAIQSDTNKNNVKEQNKTARAQIQASAQEQGALLAAFSADDGSNATTDLAIAGLVDIAGQGIDASVTTSGNSIDGMETVSVTAITETGVIADLAITGVVDVAEDGYDTIEAITLDSDLAPAADLFSF